MNSDDTDGAVFLYDYVPHKAEWYASIVLPKLARIESNSKITVQHLADRVLENNLDLRNNFSSMDELNGRIISFLDNGFMVSPDSKSIQENLRLKGQKGCFFRSLFRLGAGGSLALSRSFSSGLRGSGEGGRLFKILSIRHDREI